MENASKALIIAGGVLIGVLILTSFVLVFRSAAKTNQNYDEEQSARQLELYNSQFEVYNKSDNTIIDLLSVINLAYDTNVSSNYDKQNSVDITIQANSLYFMLKNSDKIKKNKILKSSSENIGMNSIDENNIISIYKLTNSNFSDLEIDKTGSLKDDTLLMSRLSNDGKTIFKYLFKCTGVTYHTINGKIESMKFQMTKYNYWDNPENDNEYNVNKYT